MSQLFGIGVVPSLEYDDTRVAAFVLLDSSGPPYLRAEAFTNSNWTEVKLPNDDRNLDSYWA